MSEWDSQTFKIPALRLRTSIRELGIQMIVLRGVESANSTTRLSMEFHSASWAVYESNVCRNYTGI